MTDIRLMTDDEITKLNQGTIGTKIMTEVKAPKKTKNLSTKQKPTTPAHGGLVDPETEEIEAAMNASRTRSEFSNKIDSLEVGGAVKALGGDLARLRQKISVLAKKHGKKFIARAINGNVIIVRVAPDNATATQNDNVI